MMSVADRGAVGDDKKTAFCEDSTDSDNDTERKPLLRRISTSKCVGRLVRIVFTSCGCELGRARQRLSDARGTRGNHVLAETFRGINF